MPKFPTRVPRPVLHALAVLLLAVFTTAGVLQVTDNQTPAPPAPASPTATVTVQLGGPGNATVPAAAPTPAHGEADLVDTVAPSPAAIAKAKALTPAGQPTIPATLPLAAANVPGCKTALVRNYSSRAGAPVLLGILHWTGSAVTPGWAGIDGNLKWFDTLAAGASSNELTDSWGNCALAVPEALKPWTNAAFNRWSVTDEIVNPGVLPLFHSQAGFDRVVDLLVGWHDRWKIPLQLAKTHCTGPYTGVVDRPGINDHKSLGPCGGGHPDLGTYNVQVLIDAAKKIVAARHSVTAVDRSTCRKLNWWRAHGRPHGLPETRAVRRRRALAARGVLCTAQGPRRIIARTVAGGPAPARSSWG